jgi:hypothetical protein
MNYVNYKIALAKFNPWIEDFINVAYRIYHGKHNEKVKANKYYGCTTRSRQMWIGRVGYLKNISQLTCTVGKLN